MRPAPFSDLISHAKGRVRRGRGSSILRKSQRRRMALEALEDRTLMDGSLPLPTVAGWANVSNPGNAVDDNSHESSPSIVVNPLDSQKLVAVWTRVDTDPDPDLITVEAAFSANGGANWTRLNLGGRLINPTSAADDPQFFPRATDGQVGFDRDNNVYVLVSQHTDDNGVGALLLNKFNFSGGSPTTVFTNRVVHSWVQDPVSLPMMAVNSNVGGTIGFTDPTTGAVQNDPSSGNVYVAWVSNDANMPNVGDTWNPNAIRMIASSNGGQSFSGIRTVNDGGNFGDQRNTRPRLAISQGRAGSGTITPGQVTVVWDDFGTGAGFDTPIDFIRSDRVQSVQNIAAAFTPG